MAQWFGGWRAYLQGVVGVGGDLVPVEGGAAGERALLGPAVGVAAAQRGLLVSPDAFHLLLHAHAGTHALHCPTSKLLHSAAGTLLRQRTK